MEDLTRLFVVCGKAAEVDMLTAAFNSFGVVQNVKLVRDKGVAYIKFDKASAAARAIEVMHEAVLNEGRGPLLKVFLAEAPNSRRGPHPRGQPEDDGPVDPDNMPARSRLFLVVPKAADAAAIEANLASFQDLQYCKTDLIATKGVVFCKYAKSSSALAALETVTETGALAGYKVKCMLAEPKGKRSHMDSSWSDPASPLSQQSTRMEQQHHHLGYSNGAAMSPVGAGSYRSGTPYSPTHSSQSVASLTSGFHDPWTPSNGGGSSHSGGTPQSGQGMQEYHMHNAFGALTSLASLQAIAAMQGAANLSSAGGIAALGSNLDFMNSMNKQANLGGLGGLGINNGSSASSYGGSKQRLFVVIHKSATEEMVARIFRSFPGMEYCDLKRDRVTGQSKGFCYVYYASAEAAAAAMDHLNGAEFPPSSGHRLKVMYADPMGSKTPNSRSPGSAMHMEQHPASEDGEEVLQASPPVPGLDDVHTPRGLSHSMPSDDSQLDALEHSVDVAAVQNSLAHMSMPRAAVRNARRPQANSPGCENEWEAESAATDECLVYTVLTRPLPDYALQHTFSEFGHVMYVRLQRDARFGVVKFATADSARAALGGLNGTNICGQALAVSLVDPLQSSRITKRARVAE